MRITPDQIALPIGDKPGTTCRQEARHEAFIIDADLQMTQRVRIVCVSDDGTTTKAEAIRQSDLSPARMADSLITFQDRLIDAQTRGAYVDAAGRVLDTQADGFDPEKAIPQKTFFQNVTLGDLEKMGAKVGKTAKLADLIYFMLANEINNLYQREQI